MSIIALKQLCCLLILLFFSYIIFDILRKSNQREYEYLGWSNMYGRLHVERNSKEGFMDSQYSEIAPFSVTKKAIGENTSSMGTTVTKGIATVNAEKTPLPLKEYIVMSSYNSARSGKYMNVDMIKYVLSKGCRFLDFQVFFGPDPNPKDPKNVATLPFVAYSSNTSDSVINLESLNQVLLNDVFMAISKNAFSSPSPNPGDPLFINLRIYTTPTSASTTDAKSTNSEANTIKLYQQIALLIYTYFNSKLYKEESVKNDNNGILGKNDNNGILGKNDNNGIRSKPAINDNNITRMRSKPAINDNNGMRGKNDNNRMRSKPAINDNNGMRGKNDNNGIRENFQNEKKNSSNSNMNKLFEFDRKTKAIRIHGNTPLSDIMGKIIISLDIKVAPDYKNSTSGAKDSNHLDLASFVNIENGSSMLRNYYYTDIIEKSKDYIFPKDAPNANTSTVKSLTSVYPNSNPNLYTLLGYPSNPNPYNLISQYGVQYTFYEFHNQDNNFNMYYNIFANSGSAFVTIADCLRYIETIPK